MKTINSLILVILMQLTADCTASKRTIVVGEFNKCKIKLQKLYLSKVKICDIFGKFAFHIFIL